MKKRILLTTMLLALLIVCIPVITAFAETYVTYEDGYIQETKNLWFIPSGAAIILAIVVSIVVGVCLLRWHTKKPSVNVYKKYMIGEFVLDYRRVRGRISLNDVVDIVRRM